MTYYIYCITNKINNKSYVGQSIDTEERWKDHISDAFRKVGKTAVSKKYAIHNAIAKYSVDSFLWQVIDQYDTLDEANEAEEFYIAYFQTLAPNGYNLHPGGRNKKPSQATKDKIREKLKIVGSFVGKRGPDHPNFGTKFSEERKMEQSKRLSGDNGPGKKITSIIARQIYLDYLENTHIKIIELAEKYGLKHGATLNILNKKCWKDATKDLPAVNLKDNTQGENWVKSKLKENDVLDIISKYKTGNYIIQELADHYSISNAVISNIINNKSWKHIKRN